MLFLIIKQNQFCFFFRPNFLKTLAQVDSHSCLNCAQFFLICRPIPDQVLADAGLNFVFFCSKKSPLFIFLKKYPKSALVYDVDISTFCGGDPKCASFYFNVFLVKMLGRWYIGILRTFLPFFRGAESGFWLTFPYALSPKFSQNQAKIKNAVISAFWAPPDPCYNPILHPTFL